MELIPLLMFLAVNGHLIVLELLITSFETLPIGIQRFNPEAFILLARYGGTIFATGLLLALPALAVAYRDQPFSTPAAPGRMKAKCRDLESCQAEGERRAAEAEAKAGPVRHVGPLGANGLGRVRYRAMKETEDGPPLRPG